MPRVLFIERRFQGFYSIERVFRRVAADLGSMGFETSFEQVPHPAGLAGMLRNLIGYRPSAADIFHITGDITYVALVTPPERTVLTIHDLSILKFRTGLRRWLLRKLLFEWPVRRSRYITTVSEATAAEIRALAGNSREVLVIENPVDDAFLPEPKPPFNTVRPNILQIGTLQYKNLSNLASALEGIDCRLTVIGRLDPADASLFREKKIELVNESNITDEAVREHYRNADLLTFCSTFEGFGLPIIEAQAMRTPVVTSDLEPMRSVAGGGAVLVDPHDPASIRQGIQSVIGDPELRRGIVENGVANVCRFAPASIARRYAELYNRVLAGRRES